MSLGQKEIPGCQNAPFLHLNTVFLKDFLPSAFFVLRVRRLKIDWNGV